MEGPAIVTQSFLGIYQEKNFENRSTFVEVMVKSQVYCFFETQCRPIARYWSKIADLNLPHLYLVTTRSEFRRDIWHRKIRVPGISYGVICVIVRLAVLMQCRLVTDRQTDGLTLDDSIYRANIYIHRHQHQHRVAKTGSRFSSL